MKASSFCVLPFLSVTCFQTGAYRLCCHDVWVKDNEILWNGKNTSIEELRNSKVMNEIRKKMLSWKKVTFCSECDIADEKWFKSRRSSYNERFSSVIPEIFSHSCIETWKTSVNIRYFDIRFSNICNLSCRMCFSESSSARQDLDRLLGRKVFQTTKDVWKIDTFMDYIDHVEELYFAGGEPLIDPSLEWLLDKIILHKKNQDITLRINTNLTFLPSSLLEKIKKFKRVFMIISCDWYEKSYEYIRIWSSWENFLKNLIKTQKFILSFSNRSSVAIVSVAQIDNIYSLYNIYQLCNRIKIWFSYNILKYPLSMDVWILPKDTKNDILMYYDKKLKNDEKWKKIFADLLHHIKYSNENPDLYLEYMKDKKIIDNNSKFESR